ncbi:MAG: peptidoglycan editing factor PgeF [Bacteroidia bacterium]|nr:peptidoglycan editing factor PgeF [Bacteroidia bacterium]
MISVVKKELSVLQFANLSGFSELLHFSTTRVGGFSTNNYSSLNLGFNSGDLPENVVGNRIKLCVVNGINPDRLVFPKQTHTATVKTITSLFFNLDKEDQKRFLNETDAVITDLQGVCIAVKTADCVPILLFDPKQKVVAAVHAGWRGTVQNIVSMTIHKMVEEFGCEPSSLFAGIGPSISPEIYEVGEEVWKQFTPEFYHSTNPAKADKRLLDLWSANYQQMVFSGVPVTHIEVARICTWSDPVRFFSARRDGVRTGRMATGIMLR